MTAGRSEIVVRMGELAVSAGASDLLVSVGLGSCIGLAIVDRRAGVAGLAHVVLPECQRPQDTRTGAFAERAVPALLERALALGARRSGMEAVLVGGARMFSLSGGLDIGARNEAAVRAALAAARVPVRAAATSGSRGRTIRVEVGEGRVLVRSAGEPEVILLGSGAQERAARRPAQAVAAS